MPDDPKIPPGGALDGVPLLKFEPGALETYRERIRNMAGNVYSTAERPDLARFWGIVAAGCPLDKVEYLLFAGRQLRGANKAVATPTKILGFGDLDATFLVVLRYLEEFLVPRLDEHTKGEFADLIKEIGKANTLLTQMCTAACDILDEGAPPKEA